MTQIVLHPANGRYGGGQAMLPAPWMWWETRVGGELEWRYEPNVEDVEKVYATFGPDGDRVVITDPPSLFLIHLQEYDDRSYERIRSAMLIRSYLTARVVWHTQPGPHWQPVPSVMTCRPGWYQHDSDCRGLGERRREPEEWNTRSTFYEPMPRLRWEMTPMIVDGQSIGPPSTPLTSSRCRQCQRYLPAGGAGTTEVRGWGGDLIGVLQQGALCEECERMRSRSRRRTNRAPGVEPAPPTPGQILVFDGQGGWVPRDVEEIGSIYGQPAMGMFTPNEIREREGLPPLRYGGRTGLADEISGGLSVGVYGPAILPEKEVVDEIDRLVNDELRTGPLDDINRYPTCEHCPHQWHGEPCEKCACLGEFEDPI
jgi:hypothetical protein